MNIKSFKDLQLARACLVDKNGNWLDRPINELQKIGTIDRNIRALKDIIGLLLNSDKICEETKLFIGTKQASIKSVNDKLNNCIKERVEISGETPRYVNYVTSQNRINSDYETFCSCIEEGFIKKLINNIPVNNGELGIKLSKLIKYYGVFESSRNNIEIFIPNDILKCNSYKGNELFFEKLERLKPYLSKQKEIIEQAISKDYMFVEYFNYLLSSISIQDEQINRDRERLIGFLNGETLTPDLSSSNESNLKKALEEKENKIKELEQTIKNNENDVQSKNNKIEELNNNITNINIEIEKLEYTNNENENKIKNLEQQLENANETIKNKNIQIETLNNMVKELGQHEENEDSDILDFDMDIEEDNNNIVENNSDNDDDEIMDFDD